jgi:hypothetical protein
MAPETVFEHPREIVCEFLLTRGQKLAALARWRGHLVDKLRATDEGMTSPDEVAAASEVEMLGEIEKAEAELSASASDG